MTIQSNLKLQVFIFSCSVLSLGHGSTLAATSSFSPSFKMIYVCVTPVMKLMWTRGLCSVWFPPQAAVKSVRGPGGGQCLRDCRVGERAAVSLSRGAPVSFLPHLHACYDMAPTFKALRLIVSRVHV